MCLRSYIFLCLKTTPHLLEKSEDFVRRYRAFICNAMFSSDRSIDMRNETPGLNSNGVFDRIFSNLTNFFRTLFKALGF